MKTKIVFPSNLIGKTTNIKRITTLIILSLLSISLILLASLSNLENTSTIYMLIATCGYFGLLGVLIAACSTKKCAIYNPTKSKLVSKTFEFSAPDYNTVLSIVENKQISQLHNLQKGDGASIHLELIYSIDKKFAAYQFFKYIPYEYVADSSLHYVKDADLEKFCV